MRCSFPPSPPYFFTTLPASSHLLEFLGSRTSADSLRMGHRIELSALAATPEASLLQEQMERQQIPNSLRSRSSLH